MPDKALFGAMVSTMDNVTINNLEVEDECYLNKEKKPNCAACMGKGIHVCSVGINILRKRGGN